MKDVEKDFVGETMMKTPCCEEAVCTSCICIASQKLRDKVKKSHHPVRKIYCEHCKANSINIHEFPQNDEDQNYKQVCGFFALFWIESSFISHNRNKSNRKHWWLARSARFDVCKWLWNINKHVLKNCLFRDEDDTLFETLKTLFKNETPERVKEEEEESHPSRIQFGFSHDEEHTVTIEDPNLVKCEPSTSGHIQHLSFHTAEPAVADDNSIGKFLADNHY